MSDILGTLLEMGFDKNKCEIAISKTGGKSVQDAMDWILAHGDEIPNEVPASADNSAGTEATPPEDSNPDAAEAKSLKCDDCGKLFKTQLEVEYHASKSGHSNFSESTEEKKQLSEEEKKAQVAKLEELMKQKRKEREEKERQEELEREKNRIKSAKELGEAKRKHEEQEILKMIQQRKREKEEERQARQRVKEQIEQDKLRRKEIAGQAETPSSSSVQQPTAQKSAVSVAAPKNYSEAKLQIKLTDGSSLTQTFGAKEPLSAVRLYIEMNRTDAQGAFSLMTSFPRKVFTAEDFDKPLDSLGLVPNAVIIVTKV